METQASQQAAFLYMVYLYGVGEVSFCFSFSFWFCLFWIGVNEGIGM
jgi:hypothetical protein